MSSDKKNLGRMDEITDSFSDKLSSIAIKDLRQSLTGKTFLGAFWLGLVVCLIGSLALSGGTKSEMGQDAFVFFLGVMNVGIFIVFPLMTFYSLHSDRSDSTFELIGITSMSARKIVRGKWQSSTFQLILFMSGITPFVFLSYLLKGISSVAIIGGIFLSLVVGQFLCLMGVVSGGVAEKKGGRVVLLLVLVTLCIFVFSLSIPASLYLSKGELADTLTDLISFETETLIKVGGCLLFFLTIEWFFYELCVSQLSFYSENRSTRPRIAIFLMFIEVSLLLVFGHDVFNLHRVALTDFIIFCNIGTLFFSFFIFGEIDEVSNRIVKPYQGGKGYPFLLNRFLWPGKTRGFLFLSGIITITFLFSLASSLFNFGLRDRMRDVHFFVFYGNSLLLLSIFYIFAKIFLDKKLPPAKQRIWLVLFFLLIFSAPLLLAGIIDVFRSSEDWEVVKLLNFHNPFFVLDSRDGSERFVVFGLNLFIGAALFVVAFFALVLPEFKKTYNAAPKRTRENMERERWE